MKGSLDAAGSSSRTLKNSGARPTANLELKVGNNVDQAVFFAKKYHTIDFELRGRSNSRSSARRLMAARVEDQQFWRRVSFNW